MSTKEKPVIVGALLWLVQPLYLAVELVAASMSTAPYSLLHSTISDLGATTCTSIPYPSEDVAVCSPAHAWVNGSFIAFGAAMLVGAVLLRDALPRGRWRTAALVLWVLTALSSIGSGLTPLDQYLELHALVSAPGIVLSGVAIAATGLALRGGSHGWRALVWCGTACAVAGLVLLVRLEISWGGLLERIALWPAYAATAVVGWSALRRRFRGRVTS